MTTPVLFLTDETGQRVCAIIEITYYNALLKKLEQLRTQQKNAGTAGEASSPTEVAEEKIRNERDRM